MTGAAASPSRPVADCSLSLRIHRLLGIRTGIGRLATHRVLRLTKRGWAGWSRVRDTYWGVIRMRGLGADPATWAHLLRHPWPAMNTVRRHHQFHLSARYSHAGRLEPRVVGARTSPTARVSRNPTLWPVRALRPVRSASAQPCAGPGIEMNSTPPAHDGNMPVYAVEGERTGERRVLRAAHAPSPAPEPA